MTDFLEGYFLTICAVITNPVYLGILTLFALEIIGIAIVIHAIFPTLL